MKVDAICVWGNNAPLQTTLDTILQQNNLDAAVLFVAQHNNMWQALWHANASKRVQEVKKQSLFKCVAYINSEYTHTVSMIDLVHFEKDTLYYEHGQYTLHTGVFPWIYYCDSLTGDLAANYVTNCNYQDSIPYDFYHHLKTYRIKTKRAQKNTGVVGA